MHTWHRRRRRQAAPDASTRRGEIGASAVEFALVFPVLMGLIFGGIDLGVAIQARTAVQHATREAVRMAATGGSHDDVVQSVESSMEVLPGVYTYDFRCVTKDHKPCGALVGTDAIAGGESEIEIHYTYQSVTGMFPFLNFTINTHAEMRNE